LLKIKRVVSIFECFVILISILHLGTIVYLPDAQATGAGSIFVAQDNQGINVTLTNAFELFFNASNGGEITRYYDLATDPSRSKNLVLPSDKYWEWIPPGMLPLFLTAFYNPYTGDFASTGRDKDASVAVLGQGTSYAILQSVSRILNQSDSVFRDEQGITNYVNSTWLIRDDGHIFVERTLYSPTNSIIHSNYRWYPFYSVRTRGFADCATFYLFNTTSAFTNVVSNYTNIYDTYPVFPSDQNGIFGVASPFNDMSLGGDRTNNVVVVYDFSEISGVNEWRSDNYIGKNGNELGGTEFGATHEFDASYEMYTNTLRAMIVLTHQPITEQNVTSFADDFRKYPVFPLIKTTLSTNKSFYEIGDSLSVNVSANAYFNLKNLIPTLTETNSSGSVILFKNYDVLNFTEDQSWSLLLLNETISNTTVAGNYTFTFRFISTLGIVTALDSKMIQILSAQFGKTTVGMYLATSYAGYAMVCRYLMPRTGIVTSISLWFGNTGFDARVAIYTHPTGNLIVQSQSEPITTVGWHNFTIPPTYLHWEFYGLAWQNSLNATVAYDTGESKQAGRTPKSYGDFPSVFREPEYFDTAESIYATYKPFTDSHPPTVSYLERVPSSPNYNDTVSIFANVTEPANESGVKLVILGYWNGSAWTNITMTLEAGLYTATLPPLSYATTVNYTLWAFDYAENIASMSIYSYTVDDRYLPIARIDEPAYGSCVSNEVDVIVFANDTNIDRAELSIDGTLVHSWDSSGQYVFNWDSRGWADGAYQLKLMVFDRAGNVAEKQIQATVDNKAPLATINSPTSGSYLKGIVPIKATGNDINFEKMELYIGGEAVETWNQPNPEVYYWRTTGFPDGNYFVKLTVYDKALNKDEKEISVTIDNTRPLATIDLLTFEGYAKGTVLVNVTGEDINFDQMELKIDDATKQVWMNSSVQSYQWSTENYPDGVHHIFLIIRDKAGNIGEMQFEVTLDNTNPTIEVPSWEPEEPSINEKVNVKVKISDSPFDNSIKNVTLWYRDVTFNEWQPIEMSFTNGEWTATIPEQIKYTTIEFYIQSSDKAGNTEKTPAFKYQVKAPFNWTLVIFASFAMISTALIGTTIYLIRRIKKGRYKSK